MAALPPVINQAVALPPFAPLPAGPGPGAVVAAPNIAMGARTANNQPYNPGPAIPPGLFPPLHGLLTALRQNLAIDEANLDAFKTDLYAQIYQILTNARLRGNGGVRISNADLQIIMAEIAAAGNYLANNGRYDNQERDRVLRELANHQDALLVGGWTPKPRRKPTRRHLKKRKSVKSPF